MIGTGKIAIAIAIGNTAPSASPTPSRCPMPPRQPHRIAASAPSGVGAEWTLAGSNR